MATSVLTIVSLRGWGDDRLRSEYSSLRGWRSAHPLKNVKKAGGHLSSPLKRNIKNGGGHLHIPLRKNSETGGGHPYLFLSYVNQSLCSFFLEVVRERGYLPIFQRKKNTKKNGGGHPPVPLRKNSGNGRAHLPIPWECEEWMWSSLQPL